MKARSRRLLEILACLVTLATVGLATSLAIAATDPDPDWIGTAPKNISQSEERKALHPSIAIGPSGQIVAAWNDIPSEGAAPDIYVTYSDNRGKSWSSPSQVWDTDARSQLPDAVVAKRNGQEEIFIAWAEESNKTITVHEAEVGANSRPVPIPEADSPSVAPTGPRLVTSPGRLHVIFNAGTNFSHILYSSRALTEPSWPQATRIYTSTNSVALSPALAVDEDGTDFHVVWEQDFWSVHYMEGTTQGSKITWGDAHQLSDSVRSVKPDIAVSSEGDIHIVWSEAGPEKRSYFVRYCRHHPSRNECSENRLIDNSRPVYVNSKNPTVPAPRLALWESNDQVQLCVTWHGCRDKDQCAEESVLSCSRDGGQTWTSPKAMSSFPEGVDLEADISIWPAIAFDASGTLHGVWQQRVDIDDQDYEIYYAHNLHTVFLPLTVRNG